LLSGSSHTIDPNPAGAFNAWHDSAVNDDADGCRALRACACRLRRHGQDQRAGERSTRAFSLPFPGFSSFFRWVLLTTERPGATAFFRTDRRKNPEAIDWRCGFDRRVFVAMSLSPRLRRHVFVAMPPCGAERSPEGDIVQR
jgi:hypothetical protein